MYAIAWGGWRDLVGVALAFKSGCFIHHRAVSHYQTTSVRIETAHTLPTNLDGELVDQTPVLFALARDALRVLVPQASTAAD